MDGKACKAPAVKAKSPVPSAKALTMPFSVLSTIGEGGIVDSLIEALKEQRPLRDKGLRVKKMEDAINTSVRVVRLEETK